MSEKDIYKEWAVRSEEFWKERCRAALGEEYTALLRVARAAKVVVEQDKEQYDRLIVVLALEEALKEVDDEIE
jgi:hypothetical protein